MKRAHVVLQTLNPHHIAECGRPQFGNPAGFVRYTFESDPWYASRKAPLCRQCYAKIDEAHRAKLEKLLPPEPTKRTPRPAPLSEYRNSSSIQDGNLYEAKILEVYCTRYDPQTHQAPTLVATFTRRGDAEIFAQVMNHLATGGQLWDLSNDAGT